MHSVKVKKQIGNQEIEITVEGTKPKEILMELGKWSFNGISTCPFCEAKRKARLAAASDKPFSEDYAKHLTIQSRQTEGDHDYVFIKCLRCNAELTFGEKKKGDVIYLRTNDDHKLDWKELTRGE